MGTLTISCTVNVIKEREIDALAMPWVNNRVAHLLSVHIAAVTMVGNETVKDSSSNGYDELVFTKNAETIDAFSSCIISVRMEKVYMGECINVLHTRDGSLL